MGGANRVDADRGRIQYAVVQLGDRRPFYGEGAVFTMTVRALGEGTTILELPEHSLASATGESIAHQVLPGEITVIAPVESTPTPPAASLRFEPAMSQIELNQETAIALRAEHVRGLYGLALRIAYDPTIVELLDSDTERDGIQVESGEAPYPDFVVRNEADPAAGEISYAAIQLNPRSPFDGAGTVLTLHLRGRAEGVSALHVTDWQLVDAETYEIETEAAEGSVGVGPAWHAPPGVARSADR